MRQLVLGDIHGNYKALQQVLNRANFCNEDELICLGDIVDGGPDSKKCISFINKYASDIILGNHDLWFSSYVKHGVAENVWTSQGGRTTLKSFGIERPTMNGHLGQEFNEARELFKRASLYVRKNNDKIFVHGGYDFEYKIDRQPSTHNYYWDRSLFAYAFWKNNNPNEKDVRDEAFVRNVECFKKVFLGHTPTYYFTDSYKPLKAINVWNLDTGAGSNGKLTLMDANTEEYWQSDTVQNLYGYIFHR